MVIVMDMSTGKTLDPLDCYGDEVLNAGWLPLPQLGLQTLADEQPTLPQRREPAMDVAAILAQMYLNQE